MTQQRSAQSQADSEPREPREPDTWAKLVRAITNDLRACVCDAAHAGWVLHPCSDEELAHLWREQFGSTLPLGKLLCAGEWTCDDTADETSTATRHLWVARSALSIGSDAVDVWRAHSLALALARIVNVGALSRVHTLNADALNELPALREVSELNELTSAEFIARRHATSALVIAWLSAGHIHLRASHDSVDIDSDSDDVESVDTHPAHEPTRALRYALDVLDTAASSQPSRRALRAVTRPLPARTALGALRQRIKRALAQRTQRRAPELTLTLAATQRTSRVHVSTYETYDTDGPTTPLPTQRASNSRSIAS